MILHNIFSPLRCDSCSQSLSIVNFDSTEDKLLKETFQIKMQSPK